jgi:hypothetical protein
VLVGPPRAGEWAELATRHRGRLHVLGPVADVNPFYAAADLYLDSYPSRSGTSVLEAALYGVPVLSLADLGEKAEFGQLYQADSPGLSSNPRATSQEKYVAMARTLVRNPELRAQWGADARSAVRQAHCGDGWGASLEALYEKVRTVPISDLAEYGPEVVDDHYGAMLLAYGSSELASLPVTAVGAPLREQLDLGLQADLFALANRDNALPLTVRVSAGWEDEPDWTSRLLALAGTWPRLAVSLPFAGGDDALGSGTTALLTGLLTALGTDPEGCGTISVDTDPPATAGPSVTGELPLTTTALDTLERFLSTPSWRSHAATSVR